MIELTLEDLNLIIEDVSAADEFLKWDYNRGNTINYSFFDLLHTCRRRRKITKILTKEANRARVDQ